MNNNSPERAFHHSPEFQKALAHCAYLSILEYGTCSVTPDLLHQNISGCCQQEAELVGLEVRTTGAVYCKTVMQFFDLIFHIPAAAIDLINPLRFEGDCGDDLTGIIPSRPSRVTDNFRFDNQSAVLFPCLGLIADVRKQGFSMTGNGRQDTNRSHERIDLSFEGGIAGKSNQIFNMCMIQIIQNGGGGKAAVETNSDLDFWKYCTQTRNDSRKNANGSTGAVRIAGTKDRGEEIFFTLLVKL